MEFIITLLPEPVEPAINRCGIFSKSTTQDRPDTSLPKHKERLDFRSLNAWEVKMSLSFTLAVARLGTSTPTKDLPGIGASIRKGLAAKARDKSLARAVMRASLMPSAGFRVYWVMVGPTKISPISTAMSKLAKVLAIFSLVASISSALGLSLPLES